MARPRPVKPQVHEAYLRARHFFNKYSPEGFRRSIEYVQKALAIDAAYAPAWAALVPAYGGPAYWGFQRPRDVIRKSGRRV